MELTIFLAKVIGAYLIICGASILLKQKSLPSLADQILNSLPLRYLAGTISLVLGLLLVGSHNFWGSLPQMVVSLVGWAALLKGASLMLLPENTLAGLLKIWRNKNLIIVGGVVAIALGVYLLSVWYQAIA